MGLARKALLVALVCMGTAAADAQKAPIILNTDIFPPYQVREGDELRGTAVTALECIFSAMDLPFEIRVMPWERAIFEVSQQRADGFFSATKMRRATPFAMLSAPLALEKWYWYSNHAEQPPGPSSNATQVARIGAIRGSNQVSWLLERGYSVDHQVSSTEQLLRLLERGRIDAFLADQRTLRTELTRLPLGLRPQFEHFQQYANLGVYFSSHFLQQHPDFLTRFNSSIYHCLPELHTLTAAELEQIKGLHAKLFSDWPHQPQILEAVRAQNTAHQSLEVPTILQLDKQWIGEAAQQQRPLIDSVMAAPLSVWLSKAQEQSNGLITEIMVTDRLGLNVAVSEVTTDYWQGDEAKFSDAFFNTFATRIVGPLEYDQSAQSFQVHVSSQIHDPDTGETIGVLIIGLDIEHALQMN